MIAASVVAGAAFGAAMIVALGALARLRHLLFDTVTANIDGIASVLARLGLEVAADRLRRFLAVVLHYWPWLVLGNAVVTVIIVSLVGWWALSRVLDRMRASPMCTSWMPRPTALRSRRCRCGWSACASATRAPTTTPCPRSACR
ncbi:transmembrane ATP-binding ABC transporter domain protein [Mycobacterium xenopi 4042]|uniref:Transmembrane ATP-binding ABC transporter domain protein n=1 Tax=Mycobacterium xenopi 4042 TaxID=1299334 RepID=X8ARJ7_MYCXE|nr:transmembrane ATP-binding ABC transporter domain protein [Mycobacterium xenopi 4042]